MPSFADKFIQPNSNPVWCSRWPSALAMRMSRNRGRVMIMFMFLLAIRFLSAGQVVELEGGSVMMNMRSLFGRGFRVVSLSQNGGQTWGRIWHDRTLIEP